MEDIERHNFWHSELDAQVKKDKETQAVVDFAKRLNKPFEGLSSSFIWEKGTGKTKKGA